jgi:hypothetical protein
MAIYFTHYNFVRMHQTLKVPPDIGRRRDCQTLGNAGYGWGLGGMGGFAINLLIH